MNWSNDWGKPVIIPPPKTPFSEVLRENNLKAEEAIKKANQELIIGIAYGKDDKTVVSIKQGNNFFFIGESIDLVIPINSGWTRQAVKAIKINDLAVITSEELDWCVVHIPTLTRFDNAIPTEEDCTIEELCLWCWKVQQEWFPAWKHLREHNNQTYKNIDPEQLEAFKQYCLSIAIK